jgi:hypothetical protein
MRTTSPTFLFNCKEILPNARLACKPSSYQTCLYGTDYNQDKNIILNLVQSQDTYTIIDDAIELLLGGIPKIDALLQQAFHKFDASEEISDEDIPFLFIFVILCLR